MLGQEDKGSGRVMSQEFIGVISIKDSTPGLGHCPPGDPPSSSHTTTWGLPSQQWACPLDPEAHPLALHHPVLVADLTVVDPLVRGRGFHDDQARGVVRRVRQLKREEREKEEKERSG